MKTPSRFILGSALLGCMMISAGCADLGNNSSPYGGGYNDSRYDPYPYGDSSYDRRRERDRTYEERRALERERERYEDERRRLEDERRREQEQNRRPPPPPPSRPAPERCPSGFSPSEQKCSPQERRNGCKDIRLPGGLGCVRR